MLSCRWNAGDDEKSVEDNIHVGNLNGEVLFQKKKKNTASIK
jgi:hypothetical protein